MKKARFLFMAAAAVTLAACSGDEHEGGAPTDAEGDLIAARFSAGIGEAVPVRASGASWATDDKIGISAASTNDALYQKYKNVKYAVSSDGTLTGETIYFQDMNSVTFTAYYPYTATSDMEDGVISGSTAAGNQTSDNQPTIDYLFATATTTYASPSISLNFKHKMSKIEVKLTHDASISDDEFKKITEYTIGGLALEGTFDTADGEATTTGTAKDLTLGVSTTSAIVYPQTATDFTISLTMDGNTYQCSLGSVTFEAGNSYAYTVTMKRTGLEVDTAKINTWTNDDTVVTGTAEIDYTLDITSLAAADLTDDVIASHIVDGKLVVKGTYDQAKLAKISAYVRSGNKNTLAITTLDLSGMTGLYRFTFNSNEGPLTYFKGSNSLTTAILPTTVSDIRFAFEDCTALTSVTGLDKVTVTNRAFRGCTSLKTAPDMPRLTTLDDLIFYKSGITEYSNNKVTTMGESAFEGCTSLTSTDLSGSSLTTISSNAFKGCSKLTSISLPNSLTTISSNAFNGCSKLTSITLPNSLTTIEISAFEGCTSLTSIDLSGSSLTMISSNAFKSCSKLTSITLPDGLTEICMGAFQGCTSLTSISLPDGLTTIGDFAFYNCTSLTSITIPANVTAIGNFAFNSCSNVVNVTCHAKEVPTCGSMGVFDVASGCTLYVPEESISKYQAADGWKIFVNQDYDYGGIKAIE